MSKSEIILIYLFFYFETKVSSLINNGRDLLRIIRNYLTKQPAANNYVNNYIFMHKYLSRDF